MPGAIAWSAVVHMRTVAFLAHSRDLKPAATAARISRLMTQSTALYAVSAIHASPSRCAPLEAALPHELRNGLILKAAPPWTGCRESFRTLACEAKGSRMPGRRGAQNGRGRQGKVRAARKM